MKVNLGSGETEKVYEMERNSSAFPMHLNSCGRYVFFYLDGINGGISESKRYSITDQGVESGWYVDACGYTRLYLKLLFKLYC